MPAPAPLLSILIPTRNRTRCAKHAIGHVLGFSGNDFELVVHDNSDDGELASWIPKHLGDSRLKYVQSPGELSISQNFEETLSHARGEFVCCLGDDDGVDRQVIQVARWMQRNRIDAVSFTHPVLYYWPGLRALAGKKPGQLIMSPQDGAVSLADPEQALLRCIGEGAVQIMGMPTLYHGIARRSCLEAVKEKTGKRLPGVSPDMAAAVALASNIQRFCVIDYPVIVPGASPSSGAGRGVAKTHQGKLSNEKFLDSGMVESWPERVPAFFSGPTMWAAAAVQALEATGRGDLLSRFNYPAVHAACAVHVPAFRKETRESLAKLGAGSAAAWLKTRSGFAAGWTHQWWRRAKSLLSRRANQVISPGEEGHTNIREAMEALEVLLPSLELSDLEESRVASTRRPSNGRSTVGLQKQAG